MPKNGSATLDDCQFAGISKLWVHCSECGRQDEHDVQQLIGELGFEYTLTDLLRRVSKDCPRRKAAASSDECGAFYPQLKRVD